MKFSLDAPVSQNPGNAHELFQDRHVPLRPPLPHLPAKSLQTVGADQALAACVES